MYYLSFICNPPTVLGDSQYEVSASKYGDMHLSLNNKDRNKYTKNLSWNTEMTEKTVF